LRRMKRLGWAACGSYAGQSGLNEVFVGLTVLAGGQTNFLLECAQTPPRRI
jgi:hypothetical protein